MKVYKSEEFRHLVNRAIASQKESGLVFRSYLSAIESLLAQEAADG